MQGAVGAGAPMYTGHVRRVQMKNRNTRLLFTALAAIAMTTSAEARITRIVIEHKDSPAYKGQSFGEAGRYEWLRGHAYGELDPRDPLNAIITDLQFAPRNARGLVEYSAT